MSRSVTIVGGGVIGLSLAWELVRRGIKTTVLQRDEAKRTTSWSAAGILPPARLDRANDPLDKLRGLSHQLYPDWIDQLESATGMDCGFRKCGGWYLANTLGEKASLIGMTGYWDELGVQCDSVAMEELTNREPALSAWAHGQASASAWWLPDEWQIRPPHLLSALRAACESLGANILDRTHITEINPSTRGNRYRANGQWHDCDDLVLCAGAWSGQIAETLGLKQSVIPIRGQMLLLKSPQPDIKAIINVGQRYLVPRDDGHILVGSCEEETGFEQGTTPGMIQSLNEFAVSIVPSLQNAKQAGTWFGIRPMTFDGFPMIGRVPDQQGLFIAAGHFRSGWHLAPGTAKCLAAMITGESTPIELDAFGIGKKQIKQQTVTT